MSAWVNSVGAVRARIAGVVRSRAARSSAWALLGQVAGVLASMANFLLLARLLGPAEYGLVAGAWALVLAVGPIMTLGTGQLLTRDYTVTGDARSALGAGLMTSLTGSSVGIAVLVGLHPVLLPQVPVLLLGSLAVAEVLAASITGCLIALSFAAGDSRAAGISTVLVACSRLTAVAVFAVGGGVDAVDWAVLYAGVSLTAALLQLAWGWVHYGRPSVKGYSFFRRVREGLPYFSGTTAGVVQVSADKVLLVRFGLVEEAGLYAVAYRLASMASMPVIAVLQAMLPRWFAAGATGGLAATASFGRRLLRPLAAYGVLAALALAAAAAVLPDVLGEDFARSAPLLLLLAPLPLLRLMQSITGDALTGAGRQGTRTACTTTAAVVSIGTNLALIPWLGLTGVLVAVFVANVVLLVLLRLALRRGLRSARTTAAQPS